MSETDFTAYADKPATDLQTRFVPWLVEKTGYDPATAKTKAEAFAAGVKLAVYLRIPFQASDENKQATAARREERNTETETARAERLAAREAKRAEKAAAAAERAEKKESAGAAKAAKSAAATVTTPPAKVAKAKAAPAAKATPAKTAGRKIAGRTPAPF